MQQFGEVVLKAQPVKEKAAPYRVRWVRRSPRRRAYGFFPAAVIPITSLGRAGVYFGNTRAFVACSKS